MRAARAVRILGTTLFIAGLLIAASPPYADADSWPPGKWKAETLDQGVSTGVDTSTVYYPVYQQHHVFNQGMESGNSVLRHGWFQPGYDTWAFETLDNANSTGVSTTTTHYPLYQQHHVFNQGMESGNSVLRHGWFQPGYDTWAFETLDAGVSIGSGVATVVFGDQHHVFNAGTDTGQSALRHGWFDPTVGTWQFETVDFGKSDSTSPGSGVIYDDQLHVFASAPTGDVFPGRELRHGRRDSVSGIWAFETLDPYEENSGCENSGLGSAIVGSDGNLNWFGERLCNNILGIPNQIPELRHAWYDAAGWHYETLNRYDDSPSIPSTSSFHGNSEVFGRSAELFPCGHHGGCLGHMWWDGAWHVDYPDLDTAGVNPVSTSTYPTFDQLHAFFAGGSGLRHVWYQPT